MGIGTQELFDKMKKGQVSATEFIEVFTRLSNRIADLGGAYDKSTENAAAKLNDFSNAWFMFKKELSAEGGNVVVTGTMDAVGGVLNFARDELRKLQDLSLAAAGKPSVVGLQGQNSLWAKTKIATAAALGLGAQETQSFFSNIPFLPVPELSEHQLVNRAEYLNALNSILHPEIQRREEMRRNAREIPAPPVISYNFGEAPGFTLIVNGDVGDNTVKKIEKVANDTWLRSIGAALNSQNGGH